MFDKIVKRLFEPINTSIVGFLGIFNLFIGIWVLLPFDSLGPSSNLIPESILGIATSLIGALIIFGSIKENMRILSYSTGAGFIEWIGLMGVVLYLNWKSTGWIIALMVAICCGFVHLNIRLQDNLRNKI